MGRLSAGLVLILCAGSCVRSEGGGGDGGPGGSGGPGAGNPTRVEGYARGDVFSRLVLEIDSVAGVEPRATSTDAMIATLEGLVSKPDGIVAVNDGIIESRGEDHGWTNEELGELASQHFDLEVSSTTIKIHAMFLDGHYAHESGGRVLGLAWSNRHLVLFQRTIEDLCQNVLLPPIVGATREEVCARSERLVWRHEIGHVLGLVNIGAPMVEDHEDPDHRAHDVSEDCVMYWAHEGESAVSSVVSRIVGSEPELDFDQACRDDIAAVRGD